MKLNRVILLVLVCAGLSILPVASAAPDAPAAQTFGPVADDFANNEDDFLAAEGLVAVGGSNDPAGTGFVSQNVTYLRFDLSTLPIGTSLTSATLTMRSLGFLTNSTNMTMRLYGSPDVTWAEGSTEIPWASRPTPADYVDLYSEVVGLPTAAGLDIVFPNTTQFAQFVEDRIDAGGLVTIVIQATTCAPNASRQYMATLNTTGTNAVPAKLTLEGTTPTAVELSSTSAERTSLPLYAGLGAVALIVVAGLAISRRRTA